MTNNKLSNNKFVAVYLTAENVAYLDSVFFQSYNFTVTAILERVKALGVPLQVLGVSKDRDGKTPKRVHIGGELLTYLQSIKIGALTATIAAAIDTARRLNINPFAPLPTAPNTAETNGENLPSHDGKE